MKVDVIGSNSLLFANLPPASQVPGRTYRVSNVGPAPGILLTSDGTKYRPAGGRQVLAMRANNPVTVQSTSPIAVDQVGPFPGGFVRAGMWLEVDGVFLAPAISASSRDIDTRIGNSTGAMNSFFKAIGTANAAYVQGRYATALQILSDTSAAHDGVGGTVAGSYEYAAVTKRSPVVDFSLPWWFDILLRSTTETAVNISSATWAGGIATINTAAVHTLAVGDKTVTAGVTPTGWNIPAGAIVLTVPTTTQFTVALAADPGAYTSGGTSSRISNVISQSYVLELVG